MRRWLYRLTLSTALCGAPWPTYGQETPPSAPLSAEEKREALGRLYELRVAREELRLLRQHLEARDALDAREKAAWERSLELERRLAAVAERERDLEKARGDFLDRALRDATKGRSGWCRAKKLISLGLIRCN